jgi:very-short-patch-repair endonuclease
LPGETTTRGRIPVTTVERTLMDLASSLDAVELGALCDAAQRRGILHYNRLVTVVRGHAGAGRRRLAPIHEVLADRVPGYDPAANDWERDMDRSWDRMGLPAAVKQHRIRIGHRIFIIDRAIVDLKIAVEWNGFEHHGSRTAFDRDSDRRALLAAAGWFPLDFTSRSNPDLICRSVLAVVQQRLKATG